ncbi:MAG: hypothetical protein LBO05_11935 [Deltaproteobacteria bacterium]|jgi:hypothetical protein|nr:hypothetical protein [Deltaproteobacteria bacterium]
MDGILNMFSEMFGDSSSSYYLGGGAFLLVFIYLIFSRGKGGPSKKKEPKPPKQPKAPKPDKAEAAEAAVDKKMAKLAAKAAKEAQKKAAAAAKLAAKHKGKLPPPAPETRAGQDRGPAAFEPAPVPPPAFPAPLFPDPAPAPASGAFRAVALKAAQNNLILAPGQEAPRPAPPQPTVAVPPPVRPQPQPASVETVETVRPEPPAADLAKAAELVVSPVPAPPARGEPETPVFERPGQASPRDEFIRQEPPVGLLAPGTGPSSTPVAPQVLEAVEQPAASAGVRIASGTQMPVPAPGPDYDQDPSYGQSRVIGEDPPFGQSQMYEAPDPPEGARYFNETVESVEPAELPAVEIQTLTDAVEEAGPRSTGAAAGGLEDAPSPEERGNGNGRGADFEEDGLEPVLDLEAASVLEAPRPPEPPRQTLVQPSPSGGSHAPDAGELEDELPPPEAPEPPAAPVAAPVAAPLAAALTLPQARPMSILEGRGGVLKASQTQMSTPIQIDQTQLPRVMKQAAVETPAPGQTQGAAAITVQELDVTYQRNIFLNSLEITYYKLLRAAFTQFLIFPKVTSRAAVTAISRNADHLKVAENVLTNTTLSFVICDVKLNIKAVVEVVDESQTPANKDRARDYILKKAGLMVVRFYSGDTPPDVATLRRLLTD